jgi:cell wall-associated NlpC family hydrolase
VNRKLAVAGLLAGSAGLLATGPVILGLVTVLFAGAGNDPCVLPAGLAAPAGGPVRLPVTGSYTPTSEFGMRHNPGPIGHGAYRMHTGLDLAEQPAPGPVVAAAAGVVQDTPTSTSGGNQVVLDHGGGLTTRYLHLASRTVSVGDTVGAGRPIGQEGATGNTTGPHVHFEVVVNGRPVDPRPWLAEQGVTLAPPGRAGTAPPPVPVAPAGETGLTVDAVSLHPVGAPGLTQPVVSALPARVGPYRAEQVLNAAYIVKAGQAMGLDAWTITVGVMTAMGESSLRVLGYGDTTGPDSRGLFQQRAGWGTVAERMDPATSARRFFTALTVVPGYRSLEPTIAAHRAQHNADPYHYRSYWPAAVQMVATLTGDPALLERLPVTGPVTGCEDAGPAGPPVPGDGSGAAVVVAARQVLGTAYSWGGGTVDGPSLGVYQSTSLDGSHTVGFDCSGLVLYAVYQATGVRLAHDAEQQGEDPRGRPVPRDWSKMRPGDVISFSEDGSGAPGSFGHVGIYLGEGKMIHAPRPGRSVEVTQLRGSAYYEPMVWSIRRYASTSKTAA